MDMNKGLCEKKESQIETEIKNLSSSLSQLEEALPALFSTLNKILAPEISVPGADTLLNKNPEALCPLAEDMRHSTRRVKDILNSVREMTGRIRL